MDQHEALYKKAIEAIYAVFGDTSVSKERTEESLNGMIEEIEDLRSTLNPGKGWLPDDGGPDDPDEQLDLDDD